MRTHAKIVAEEVPYICERLRADGNGAASTWPLKYAAPDELGDRWFATGSQRHP